MIKPMHCELSSYLVEKTIGKGTFGKVKKGRHKLTGQPVAIKILEKDKIKDVTDVERVSRQLHILKMVRHSSIAQLYEIIETSTTIYIIMEYASNGQFFDYVMDAKICNEFEAHHYFVQIVAGLEYLHHMRVCHRDIKPENMLLDVGNRIKIVDFGLSNMYRVNQRLVTACGSPCYASPEMIKGEQYDPEKSDVWSLGIVLYTMAFAKLPFEEDNTSVLYSKIKSGMYVISRKISLQLKDLLSRLINVSPQQRLQLRQIKTHPWYTKFKQAQGHGINIGFERIPIDDNILRTMQSYGHDQKTTRKYLEYNIKNACTATYYLFLKKHLKMGLGSQADICSSNFNYKLLGTRQRQRKNHSIDFNALVERIDNTRERPEKCLSQPKWCESPYTVSKRSSKHLNFDSLRVNKNKSLLDNSNKVTRKNRYALRKQAINAQLSRSCSKNHNHSMEIQKEPFENISRRIFTQGDCHQRQANNLQVKGIQKNLPRSGQKLQNLNISDMFWKKKATVHKDSRGITRYCGK